MGIMDGKVYFVLIGGFNEILFLCMYIVSWCVFVFGVDGWCILYSCLVLMIFVVYNIRVILYIIFVCVCVVMVLLYSIFVLCVDGWCWYVFV